MVSSLMSFRTIELHGYAGHHKDQTSEVYHVELGTDPLVLLQWLQQVHYQDECGKVLVANNVPHLIFIMAMFDIELC